MSRRIYDLQVEPRDAVYRGLVDYATEQCEIALLVKRKGGMEAEGQLVLDRLGPFLRDAFETSEWPGTRLHGETAVVLQYRLTPEVAAILKAATHGLYGWVQTALPEDLCFLRNDDSPFLVSIAHEKDGFLSLTPEELGHLLEALPGLDSCLAT